jgi:predicted transcriptional regulator
MRTFGGKEGVPLSETKPPSSVSRGAGRSNGQAKRDGASVRARSNCAYASPTVAAKHALLALMRANQEAPLTEIIQMNGRPRNSTVSSLKRLEKAGLVKHAGRGKWTEVDPDSLEAATPKPAGWIAPLSGKRVARHAADGRVRDEMTLA